MSKITIPISLLLSIIFMYCCRNTSGTSNNNDNIRQADSIKEKRLDSLLNYGIEAEAKINYLDFYTKALKIDSTDFLIQTNHAYSLFYTGHDQKGAIKEFYKILKAYPNESETFFALGYVFSEVNTDSSFYYFNKYMNANPRSAHNLYSVAKLYEENEEWERAFNAIEKAIGLQPKNLSLIFLRGTYKMRLNDMNGAFKDMEIIPIQHQNEPESYFNRALCLFGLKKYKESISDCNKSIQLKPDFGNAYYIRACAESELDDYVSAHNDLQFAVSLGNKDAVLPLKQLEEALKRRKNS